MMQTFFGFKMQLYRLTSRDATVMGVIQELEELKWLDTGTAVYGVFQ